jgi:hypothetical protein
MTKPTEPTDLDMSAKRSEFLLDSMGRAFGVDLAVAELERRLDALEQAEPRLSQSVAETCKLGAK